ncbi:diamine N-acetyltransferase [Streptococcus rupicaprae]|uniref:Diamine N-acetyltransferase n=1 Tax=Streptococcus rupicaprae TaxID=759619 RepID=A0ABV2FJQ1_9STRE
MLGLRDITEDNFFNCLNLDPDLSEDYVDPVVFSLAEAWLNKNFQPKAIYQEEELIGFVSFYVGDNHYQIINFLIDQPYQGKDLGKAAVQLSLDYLKKEYQAKQVSLPVHLENQKARRFWTALGFQESDNIEDAYLYMRRTL